MLPLSAQNLPLSFSGLRHYPLKVDIADSNSANGIEFFGILSASGKRLDFQSSDSGSIPEYPIDGPIDRKSQAIQKGLWTLERT